ncbi:ErmE/ErmH/ErmO/ErmR family 23S rRNA (adenine(2058)-N(6))-methyltransferase [Nocardiopsis suaedae]|uniref:ErmE/ErmH/ErmO/ErmR family 23S rRNA (Adenine(2058)-N(6))-methyltransferase n=1 Tax=Nocardiopsis suaedae TaxID=3018444 RepID=A0ABT4TKR5_9ACTN|nr:ErmE/ErmH/ErmO/ErmR family 23S rRNA (adenine(2058)-N(6))-methyltransferase [Nocardiopsis suaedae]MDA2805308.1 ErmE/ErmH/ErmO/ErmR family 23S rRNA (adenine(2058)-N(6))-methyltransferase [Nocardiopsis suaedae]
MAHIHGPGRDGRPAERSPGRSREHGPKGRKAAGARRRSLSQNFLTDASVARRIVRAADLPEGGLVLEPGAGDGMITSHLARGNRRVTAYEVDPYFARRLSERFAASPRVRVRPADFTAAPAPRGPFSVVGNIPYSRTSAIVDWCLRARALRSATLLTQWEYARKRTGASGRWSRLTVLTWPQFEWALGDRVRRDRFHPVPRVDSGVLRIVRRPEPLLPGAALADYRALVEAGFSGVGGSLDASLRRLYRARRVDAALRTAGVERGTVVAFVTPRQWAVLSCHLLGIEGGQVAGKVR